MVNLSNLKNLLTKAQLVALEQSLAEHSVALSETLVQTDNVEYMYRMQGAVRVISDLILEVKKLKEDE